MIFGIDSLNAQIKLPVQFAIQKGSNGDVFEVRKDFNSDGKEDLFAVVHRGEENKLFVAISNANSTYTYSSHPPIEYFNCCDRIEQKGNIIKIYSNGMRYFESYTFRFNKANKTFDFIGFDSENFGNAIHDGAGTVSFNLITGNYESSINHVPMDASSPEEGKIVQTKLKRKLPKIYTVNNFNEAIKAIEKILIERNP